MKTKICITGASGFIGQNLIEFLKDSVQYEVVEFVGDLLLPKDVNKFFQTHTKIAYVVHLVGAFAGDNRQLIESNVITTANLLEGAKDHGIKKIVYTSTGAIYGEPAGSESFESDQPLPNTFYGQTKLWAEDTVRFYNLNHGLGYIILRFPNVYGPKNQKGVVHQILSDVKSKGIITINGDGTQSRNFLHVKDACQAVLLALESPEAAGTFNISNPVKTSINDLVGTLKEDHKFKVKYLPSNNNLKDLLLNIDLAKQKLGFKPKITDLLFDGID